VRASLSIIAVVCLVSGLCAAPVETIDLASSSAWTVSIDGGGSQTVAVPGNTRMSDNAVFRRGITIPASAAGNVVKVLFGAVDYGCDVYLGTTLITSHKNLMIPFEADLTGKVTAGGTYTLEVRAYSRSHYGNQIPNGCWWASLATGINRYVKLVVLPQVYVKDVYIQPSVTHDRLDFDVWVHNASAQAKTLTVNGSLAAWGASTRAYPSIPTASAAIAANSIAKVRMSVPWDLGPQSYWWPNIPFQETYTAVLHNLLLSVKEGAASLDTVIKRFGFAEWGEGPYYYTINGVRIGCQPSDGTTEAQYGADAYSTASCFSTIAGCRESWKRYMRLGVNTNRLHSSIPTETMMNAGDEVGFMMIPESGIRGFDQSGIWDSATYCADVAEMVQTCRDHPSVCRYSILNEWNYGDCGTTERMLIDAAWQQDSLRPMVLEGAYGNMAEKKVGLHTNGHGYTMIHYGDYRPVPLRRCIVGMGEYDYGTLDGYLLGQSADLMREADMGLEMRKREWSYFAIWDFYVYWRNFLTESSQSIGVDKYSFMQRCLNPYVVCDSAMDATNLAYTANWPATIPTLTSGSAAARRIIMFNGGLRGSQMRLIWEARWDSPTGTLAATGSVDTVLQPGFRASIPVSFTVPSTETATAISAGTGAEVYKETRYYFNVGARKLYFLLRSILLPALRQFAIRPSTLILSGSGSISGDIAVTSAEGTLPQLSVAGNQPWLSATIAGQGNAQTVRATAVTGGLASGNYAAALVVSAAGYEPETCAVRLTVAGAAVPARLTIIPSHTATLPNGTAGFTARVIDQFGNPVAATVAWSVAGGGTIDANGLFTSNGAPGSYLVKARISNDTAIGALARVTVTQGKPLPAGKITELLTLNNSQNYVAVPIIGPVDIVESTILSPDAVPPCDGRQIVADGQVFTWKTRTTASTGIWFQFTTQLYSEAFASLTLINPATRTVKLTAEHVYGLATWCNSQKVADFSGVAVVPNQPASTATFTLPQGANVIIFRMMVFAGPQASFVFSDAAGAALTDVRYVIDTCGAEMPVAHLSPMIRRQSAAPLTIRAMASLVELSVRGMGEHRIEIMNARGQIVRIARGTGDADYRLPTRAIGTGIYFVKWAVGAKRSMMKLIVW